jgi:hypothetical protein
LPDRPSRTGAQGRCPTAVTSRQWSTAGGRRARCGSICSELALWLIFVDHLPPTFYLADDPKFSGATEIFIFISGYTALRVWP